MTLLPPLCVDHWLRPIRDAQHERTGSTPQTDYTIPESVSMVLQRGSPSLSVGRRGQNSHVSQYDTQRVLFAIFGVTTQVCLIFCALLTSEFST